MRVTASLYRFPENSQGNLVVLGGFYFSDLHPGTLQVISRRRGIERLCAWRMLRERGELPRQYPPNAASARRTVYRDDKGRPTRRPEVRCISYPR